MEYYIYITNNCNLSCRYCCGKTIVQNTINGSPITKQKSIQNTIKYILADVAENNQEENIIVFYGGEPLLNQEDVIKVIKETQGNKTLKYFLYTNGLLLNTINPFLLKNLDYLFVSIDGEEFIHNKSRGQNSYRKIIDNVCSIKSTFSGKTVARLTITKESKLDQAVLPLINLFDNIFWQIESSNDVTGLAQFSEHYKQGITNLLDYWMSNIQNGVVKNLIPFQAISSSILSNRKHKHFRCGCGNKLRIIDIEGRVYLCDEIMCDDKMEKEKYLIKDTFNSEDWVAEKFNADCKNCNIRYLCGGRCLHAMLSYPNKKFQFYCDLTKDTIAKIKEVMPIVERELVARKINLNQINTYPARIGTEEIP